MKVGKPQSKRVSVRLRHKIEKHSASKQRKARKEAKKNPQWRSRLKKDPGIPNLFPYKDKVLAEIEESKRKKEEEQQRKRDLARAQREGKKVAVTKAAADEVDKDLMDPDEEIDEDEDEEMGESSANPMAALLASAQARAQTYTQDDDEDEDESEDEEEESTPTTTQTSSTRKALPKQALADPIKAASALIARLEATQEGMQQLLAYYSLPPLVTAGSDTTTRFLVDVARKRGRLGRGGVPNLNAAALTVLGDLNEERLRLPALEQLPQKSRATTNNGEIQIVSQLAAPFRIEGLFGDTFGGEKAGQSMDIET